MVEKIVYDILELGIYGDYYVLLRQEDQMCVQHMVTQECRWLTVPNQLIDALKAKEVTV